MTHDERREDLYRLAVLLSELDRVLHPLPRRQSGEYQVVLNPPPPLPPTGLPGAATNIGYTLAPARSAAEWRAPAAGSRAPSPPRSHRAEPSATVEPGRRAPRPPWVERPPDAATPRGAAPIAQPTVARTPLRATPATSPEPAATPPPDAGPGNATMTPSQSPSPTLPDASSEQPAGLAAAAGVPEPVTSGPEVSTRVPLPAPWPGQESAARGTSTAPVPPADETSVAAGRAVEAIRPGAPQTPRTDTMGYDAQPPQAPAAQAPSVQQPISPDETGSPAIRADEARALPPEARRRDVRRPPDGGAGSVPEAGADYATMDPRDDVPSAFVEPAQVAPRDILRLPPPAEQVPWGGLRQEPARPGRLPHRSISPLPTGFVEQSRPHEIDLRAELPRAEAGPHTEADQRPDAAAAQPPMSDSAFEAFEFEFEAVFPRLRRPGRRVWRRGRPVGFVGSDTLRRLEERVQRGFLDRALRRLR